VNGSIWRACKDVVGSWRYTAHASLLFLSVGIQARGLVDYTNIKRH
jgi:hypothetical protein